MVLHSNKVAVIWKDGVGEREAGRRLQQTGRERPPTFQLDDLHPFSLHVLTHKLKPVSHEVLLQSRVDLWRQKLRPEGVRHRWKNRTK